jgi:hypothetical protein
MKTIESAPRFLDERSRPNFSGGREASLPSIGRLAVDTMVQES